MLPLDDFFRPLTHDRQQPHDQHNFIGSSALIAALEAVSDAVFVVDRDWRLVYLNDHAETLLGRPRVNDRLICSVADRVCYPG